MLAVATDCLGYVCFADTSLAIYPNTFVGNSGFDQLLIEPHSKSIQSKFFAERKFQRKLAVHSTLLPDSIGIGATPFAYSATTPSNYVIESRY